MNDSKHATYVVGPCHHGMARPQVVADRETASDMEGSCK